jgi:CRP-like cAMP-binding protein
MEQNLLLTAEQLKLSTELQSGWCSRGGFVIKNVPAQVYLAVNREQAVVLDAFSEGSTVPEVFARLLRERRCPPLREFYELVLKAVQAGVLISGPSRKPPRSALNWPGWQPGQRALWPAVASALAALAGLGWRSLETTVVWSTAGVIVGAVVAAIALAAGQALAATILAGAGGEVYGRPLSKSLFFVHARLDLRDRLLLRPMEQVLILLAGQAPLSLITLAALVWAPSVVPPLGLAWMFLWRPWGGGLAQGLTALISRTPRLDTDSNFLFHPNQRPQMHWRPWWKRWDWRVCVIELVWAGIWTAFLAKLVLGVLGVGFYEMVSGDLGYWSTALQAVLAGLLIVSVALMLRRWRAGVVRGWHDLRQRWERFRRRREEFVFPETEADLLRIATAHPLFSLLNPLDRLALVRSWKSVTFAPRDEVVTRAEDGGLVGLVLSGRVCALRTSSSGKRVQAFSFEEDDLFGVPSCPGDEGRSDGALELRAATPVFAVVMPSGLFRSRVSDKLGAALVHDLSYRRAFLQRLKVCAHWDAHAVGRFARLAQVVAYADGEVILREGEDPRWFYIVYQGIAHVRRRDRSLARLKAGDFFGEISLLQSSTSTAEVVAQGAVRCLQIDRNSFLRFMTHNHHVALALERISSARLGHPVFPLDAARSTSAHPFTGEARRQGVCYT